MRLYSILVYDSIDYDLVYKNFNLTDFYFFSHYKIKDGIIEIADKIVRNINKEKFYQITETFNDMTFYIYIYITETNIYIVITDEFYPRHVVLDLINELKVSTDDKIRENIWQKYQDPTEVNKIVKIKKDLEDTKKIMMDSIDKIIERGEKIENLIEKTESLQTSSEVFKVRAKELNSCCNIL